MESFQEIINGKLPVLVDFYADWCGPCKSMAPVIQQIGKEMEGKARVLKINVDKNKEVVFKYGIQSVPTFIIFKSGNIAWRHSGTAQMKEIIKQLDKSE